MPEPGTGVALYIAREWVPKLVKMLGRISGERAAQLDQIASDFSDPRELARFYVEPNCQLVNPANLPDGTHHAYRKPVFETIDHFLRQPSLDRNGTNHLIVLGDAGMGKSSLLVMLWKMHLFGFWPTDVECTLLKLGSETLDEIKQIPAPARHVLLLDALDEDPSFSTETGGPKARLVSLVHASKGFRKVIISCRTQFFIDEDEDPTFAKLGHVRLESLTCPITYLSPFDDHQAAELLEKCFPDTWRNYLLFRPNTTRQRAMSISDAMGSLNMRPLLLSYIPFLLGNDPDDQDPLDLEGEDREYEIYRLMITRWLDREVIKIRERNAAVVPSAEQLREVCWQVATTMQLEGHNKISRAALEVLKSQLNAREFLADSTLEGRTLLNKDSAGNFRFAHSSIQEFLFVECCLAARHILQNKVSGREFDVSSLMRRFYEARLRANLRSLVRKMRARCKRDWEEISTRTALSSGVLLFVGVKMNEVRDGSADFRGWRPTPGAGEDWSYVVRTATAVVPFAIMDEAETVDENKIRAEVGLNTAMSSMQKMFAMDKLGAVSREQIMRKLIQLHQVDREMTEDEIVWRVKRLPYFMKASSTEKSQRWAEYTAYVRMESSIPKWSHGEVAAILTLSGQLLVGLLNLEISEDHLIQICRDELQKEWPIR